MDCPTGHDWLLAGPITAEEVGFTLPFAAHESNQKQRKMENKNKKNNWKEVLENIMAKNKQAL